ncbi:MAG: hypothetical protein ACE5EC_04840 [Phycisphaerae bacterium]
MPDSPDKIVIQCDCGGRMRVPVSGIGKQAKCPRCGNLILIQPISDEHLPPLVDAPAGSAPEPRAGEEPGFALETSHPCPHCSANMPEGGRFCTSCGYDIETGRILKTETAPDDARSTAVGIGTFILGTVFSGLGAAVGGLSWFLAVYYANVQVGYIAWGIGVLAGLGMRLGYRNANVRAGLVAGVFGAMGVVGAKAVIFFIILSAIFTGNTDDVELKRLYVLQNMTVDVLEERGLDSETATDEQWGSAANEAEERVSQMPEEEIVQRHAEYLRVAALLANEAEAGETGEVGEEGEKAADDAMAVEDETASATDEPPPVDATGMEEEGVGLSFLSAFFQTMFEPFDILWLLLAIGSAFKIASTHRKESA